MAKGPFSKAQICQGSASLVDINAVVDFILQSFLLTLLPLTFWSIKIKLIVYKALCCLAHDYICSWSSGHHGGGCYAAYLIFQLQIW